MRWETLSAQRFGRMKQWDATLTKQLVVFVGKNEAGKSTVMHLLTGLLYGYKQQKNMRSSLIQWGCRDAVIQGRLRMANGQSMQVSRTLTDQTATCMVLENNIGKELGDTALPLTGQISRGVYRNVYALTLEDLSFPEQETWQLLQDRLLGGDLSVQLRPAGDVAEELEETAQSLWRADRRGKPRYAQLAQHRRELADQLEEARKRQRWLAEQIRRHEEVTAERKQLREELTRLEADYKDAQWTVDVGLRIRQVEQYRIQAGDISPFDSLPQDIAARLADLRAQQDELRHTIEQKEQRLLRIRENMNALAESQDALDRQQTIRDVQGKQSQIERDNDYLLQMEQRIANFKSEWHERASRILTHPTGQDMESAVAGISLSSIQTAVAEMDKLQLQMIDMEDELSTPPKQRIGGTIAMSLLGLLLMGGGAAVILALVPTMTGLAPWMEGGAAAVIGLLLILLTFFSHKAKKSAALAKLQEALDNAKSEQDHAQDALQDALGGLMLADTFRYRPRHELALQVDRLQQDLSQKQQMMDDCRETRTRLQATIQQVKDLSESLLGRSTGDPMQDIQSLMQLLDHSFSAQKDREAASQEIVRIQEDLHHLQTGSAKLDQEIRFIQQTLSAARGSNDEERIADVMQRRRMMLQAETLYRQLSQEIVSLHELTESMRKGDPCWNIGEETLKFMAEDIREKREAAERLSGDMGSLHARIQDLRDQPIPADIQAELEVLDAQMADLGRERDRMILALAALKLGERTFREKHQPLIIQKASEYLSIITQGRYDRMMLEDHGKGILIHAADSDNYLSPLEKRLSRGTTEQMQFCIRLGLLDALDPEGVPLPLLLDETLVNWDDERLQQGLQLLGQLAQRRQILIFTCHDWMLERMQHTGVPFQTIFMDS